MKPLLVHVNPDYDTQSESIALVDGEIIDSLLRPQILTVRKIKASLQIIIKDQKGAEIKVFD